MKADSSEPEKYSRSLARSLEEEMAQYEQQIKKFRAGLIGDTKMQKFRLQFGTYAQRQDGA